MIDKATLNTAKHPFDSWHLTHFHTAKLTRFSWSYVICVPLKQYIGGHIDRHSASVSVDISTNKLTDTQLIYWWPIYQPRNVGQHIDWFFGRDIGRVLADIIFPTISRHSANTLTIDGGWYIGWLSYNTSKKLRLSVSDV